MLPSAVLEQPHKVISPPRTLNQPFRTPRLLSGNPSGHRTAPWWVHGSTGSSAVRARFLCASLSVCLQGPSDTHPQPLSPQIPAKLTGVLYHLSSNWGCLSQFLPAFHANHAAGAEIQNLTIPLRSWWEGPAQVASWCHIFQQRGFHSSSSWVQSVAPRGRAAAPVGPLHTSHLEARSHLFLRVHRAHLYSARPAAFSGLTRDLPPRSPLPLGPRGGPGASLCNQGGRRSPLPLNRSESGGRD